MRYFISDTHFDDNRLNLYGRDLVYKSPTEFDDFIINKWNELIKPTDVVYHLGDVAMSLNGLKKVKLLNGKKYLVKGNYDEPETSKYDVSDELLLEYFDVVVPSGFITINNERIYLNHYPTNGKSNYFNLVGHIHGTWKVQRNMINVGCDAWHFQPISEEMIKFQINGIRNYYDQNVYAGEIECNLKYKK